MREARQAAASTPVSAVLTPTIAAAYRAPGSHGAWNHGGNMSNETRSFDCA
jgi:hypothetical protein